MMTSKRSLLDCIPPTRECSFYYIWDCAQEIDQQWDTLSIGESISSNLFEWNFPDSIGKSKWQLQLFPKGQYGGAGIPRPEAKIYLTLMQCEDETKNVSLMLHLKTWVNGRDYSTRFNGSFNRVLKMSRWMGQPLISSEWNSMRTRYGVNRSGILNRPDEIIIIISGKENLPFYLTEDQPCYSRWGNEKYWERKQWSEGEPIPCNDNVQKVGKKWNKMGEYEEVSYKDDHSKYYKTPIERNAARERQPECDFDWFYGTENKITETHFAHIESNEPVGIKKRTKSTKDCKTSNEKAENKQEKGRNCSFKEILDQVFFS